LTTLRDNMPISRLAGILHAAMALGPAMWNGGSSGEESTRKIPPISELSRDLLALLRTLNESRVRYLLVGGVALLKYIEGRNTDDVDLIVATDALDRVTNLVIDQRNLDAAKARFGTLRVDLLFTSNPVFDLVQKSFATTHQFGEVRVPCATVDGLVVLKFYALPSLYRQGDVQRAALYETDIVMLCQSHNPRIEPLLDVVRPHVAPAEFHDLQTIAAEIAQRVQRGTRRVK
jgi:hypothetical protein